MDKDVIHGRMEAIQVFDQFIPKKKAILTSHFSPKIQRNRGNARIRTDVFPVAFFFSRLRPVLE